MFLGSSTGSIPGSTSIFAACGAASAFVSIVGVGAEHPAIRISIRNRATDKVRMENESLRLVLRQAASPLVTAAPGALPSLCYHYRFALVTRYREFLLV